MNPHLHHRCVQLLGVALVLAFAGAPAGAVTTNIFSTRFEASEGYSETSDLAGQNGWLKSGSGGNGVLPGFFPGEGQQAYIGFAPPNTNENQLFLWKPMNYSPLAANTPVVQFSVAMSIVDSTTTNRDDFYWSVFNTQGDQLFTLDFFNEDLSVSYSLGTNDFVWTGRNFTNDVIYELAFTMDFASNVWSATLDGAPLVTNKAITTIGAKLDLGDVDAAWILTDSARPGDNFMLFDNYSITAHVIPPSAPRLSLIERTPAGHVFLRLEGASGLRFAIDATTNFSNWTPLKTNLLSDGYSDFLDTSATALSTRLYRARWVP